MTQTQRRALNIRQSRRTSRYPHDAILPISSAIVSAQSATDLIRSISHMVASVHRQRKLGFQGHTHLCLRVFRPTE
jgi:hypothetical protein